MNQNAIAFSNVTFSYGNVPVLQHVNAVVQKGSFVGIIGPNGGGKTTLLKIAMGFLEPDQGTVSVLDQSPLLAKARIGYVPQFHRADREFPITVFELILLGALSRLSFWGCYPAAVKHRAEELLEEFELAPFKNTPFGALSGGQAQKALLARALLGDPDLLILDEPVAHIDARSTVEILHRLELLKRKKTILMVTHELKTIIERVDQVLCVQSGVSSYLPGEICEHFAIGLYHTPLLEIPATLQENYVLR